MVAGTVPRIASSPTFFHLFYDFHDPMTGPRLAHQITAVGPAGSHLAHKITSVGPVTWRTGCHLRGLPVLAWRIHISMVAGTVPRIASSPTFLHLFDDSHDPYEPTPPGGGPFRPAWLWRESRRLAFSPCLAAARIAERPCAPPQRGSGRPHADHCFTPASHAQPGVKQ